MLRLWIGFACFFTLTPLTLAQGAPASTSEAQVTFYSTGSFWKTAKPYYRHGLFKGLIFDGQEPFAQMKGGRFVTFTFPPGEHIFSANYWLYKSPKGGAHLKLDLMPGQHYYIGTYFNGGPCSLPVSR